MATTYETIEDDDAYVPDKPRQAEKRRKAKAYTPVRCGYCGTRLKCYDDTMPDDRIEEHVAKGECSWLDRNDPGKLKEIRARHFARIEANEDRHSRHRR